MKKLHRINVTIIWVCTICLSVFSLSKGANTEAYIKVGSMIVASIIATGFFVSKANDIIKGSGITSIIGVFTLVASFAAGGSDITFAVSYAALGMTLIYFNKQIILAYLCIYLPFCVVAIIIDPKYILGANATTVLAIENVFIYAIVGVLMIITTDRGGKLIESSEELFQRICKNNDETKDVVTELTSSMTESSHNIGSLADKISNISDVTSQMEGSTNELNSFAGSLDNLVKDTLQALSQNVELNKELEERFSEVALAIEAGNDGANEVKAILDIMFDTVLSSSRATEELLSKIENVDMILNDINKIAWKTNLLSINASIEAAKAGEHGKGFAVVANEIGSLAKESSESSKGIQDILTELSQRVDDVAKKTAAGTKSAIEGRESVENLLEALQKVKDTNDRVAQVVSEETRTNDEVSSKFEAVSEDMSDLISNVYMMGQNVKSVSADILEQNSSVVRIREEISKMESITAGLEYKMCDVQK
ncbi:MAG: hypothetical protein GX025_07340 [Clostridiales bacterium]|nr:hypothetical protein [Clostridiales bacterium]